LVLTRVKHDEVANFFDKINFQLLKFQADELEKANLVAVDIVLVNNLQRAELVEDKVKRQ